MQDVSPVENKITTTTPGTSAGAPTVSDPQNPVNVAGITAQTSEGKSNTGFIDRAQVWLRSKLRGSGGTSPLEATSASGAGGGTQKLAEGLIIGIALAIMFLGGLIISWLSRKPSTDYRGPTSAYAHWQT